MIIERIGERWIGQFFVSRCKDVQKWLTFFEVVVRKKVYKYTHTHIQMVAKWSDDKCKLACSISICWNVSDSGWGTRNVMKWKMHRHEKWSSFEKQAKQCHQWFTSHVPVHSERFLEMAWIRCRFRCDDSKRPPKCWWCHGTHRFAMIWSGPKRAVVADLVRLE